jgi:SAM-dependent methyltransferase
VSEPHREDNLLDRLSSASALSLHDEQMKRRERELVERRLGRDGGDVLAVGCGWHPGRHMFPAPAWRLTAVDLDPAKVEHVLESGAADRGFVGRSGELDELPDASFDVVLYRLVLHHIAYQGPLTPTFQEAARLLRPGGVLVATEPNLWHPVGAGLQAANRLGLGVAVHGTPDDIPLSPRLLESEARAAGLEPELHAITFAWRRMPRPAQRVLWPLDRQGSRTRLRRLGHHSLLMARRPA